jgi:hypothetical protein
VEEGLRGKHRIAAGSAIFDRVEGKPRQSITVADEKALEREKYAMMSDEELDAEIMAKFGPYFAKIQQNVKERQATAESGSGSTQ